MNRILKKQAGVTLMEVMVSMLVFALGMLMMIPMVATSITGNETSQLTDRVMQDVQNVVEAYKAGALADWGMDYDTGGSYRHIMWWTTETDPPTANLHVLVVEVMWEDSQQQYHFRQIKTYIYRK